MIFDFSFQGEVQINMTYSILKIIKEFPVEIMGQQATPAADHLFKVNENGRELGEDNPMLSTTPFINFYSLLTVLEGISRQRYRS